MTPTAVGSNRDGWVWHWPGPYTDYGRDWPAELDAYRRYHQNNQRWAFLAYNFAVDPDGGIWEGRGWDHRNAANSGANRSTYSLLFLGTGRRGGGEEVPPTEAALNAALRLRAEWPGDGTVRPHAEVSHTGTDCPGQLITAAIGSIDEDTMSSIMYGSIVAAYQVGGRMPSPKEVKAWIAEIRDKQHDVDDTCDYIAHVVATETQP
jgi:hypothetical protein